MYILQEKHVKSEGREFNGTRLISKNLKYKKFQYILEDKIIHHFTFSKRIIRSIEPREKIDRRADTRTTPGGWKNFTD